MAWIIDYPLVLEQMREQRMKSLYYNSGAFAFGPEVNVSIVGWLGPPDATIRSAASTLGVQIAEPYEENLARLLARAWQEHLSGRAWVMPMSHWSYELEFASRDWMPALLEGIGIDPGLLTSRNNAAAIEFAPEEPALFERLITRLLQMLQTSDFAIVFPRKPAICTLHHHKQLWWQTSDAELADTLRSLAEK